MRQVPQPRERGMTLIELAIVLAILGTLMSIAVAAVMRARLAANEGAAIASLRAVSRAQFQYQSSCGGGNFARSMTVLGTKPSGETESFLPGDLGGGDNPTHSGYVFSVSAGAGGAVTTNDCNGVPTQTRYYASAAPEEPGKSGTRSFATNQAGTMWEKSDATPPAEPFGAPARIVQ